MHHLLIFQICNICNKKCILYQYFEINTVKKMIQIDAAVLRKIIN